MKIEGLVANVTPVGFPTRAERDILEMILGVFCQIRPLLLLGSDFMM